MGLTVFVEADWASDGLKRKYVIVGNLYNNIDNGRYILSACLQ